MKTATEFSFLRCADLRGLVPAGSQAARTPYYFKRLRTRGSGHDRITSEPDLLISTHHVEQGRRRGVSEDAVGFVHRGLHVRVAQLVARGSEAEEDGVVLFVFVQDRSLYVQSVMDGGALPDALCRQIIDNDIVPRFKQGSYDAGLDAGVHSILAATRGEYKGTGHTQNGHGQQGSSGVLVSS